MDLSANEPEREAFGKFSYLVDGDVERLLMSSKVVGHKRRWRRHSAAVFGLCQSQQIVVEVVEGSWPPESRLTGRRHFASVGLVA